MDGAFCVFSIYCFHCEQRSAAGRRRCPVFLRAILGLPFMVRELSDDASVCSRFTVRAPLSEARRATALSFASCNSIRILYAKSAAWVPASNFWQTGHQAQSAVLSVTGHWSEGALVRNLTLTITLTNPNPNHNLTLTLTLTLRLYNFRTSDPSDQ